MFMISHDTVPDNTRHPLRRIIRSVSAHILDTNDQVLLSNGGSWIQVLSISRANMLHNLHYTLRALTYTYHPFREPIAIAGLVRGVR